MTRRHARDHSPHPVDVIVGASVRMRRKALNISQGELAESIGLTFQQVQKYESGANRISASKLYDIARALETPIGWFFEGVDSPAFPAADSETVHEFLTSSEGAELVRLFPKIRPAMRRRLLQLIRALVKEEMAVSQEVSK